MEALRPKIFYPSDRWVLNRTACLGSDVLKIAFPRISSGNRFHLQKARVDSLADHLLPQLIRKRNRIPLRIHKLISGADVWSLVDQQNNHLAGGGSAPQFCLLDSYSELTDQKFAIQHTNLYFYANYSDISKGALTSGFVRAEGLLDLSELASHFEKLVATIARQWGAVPIVLMTYPTDLETRELFLTRSAAISEVLYQLAAKHNNVHLLPVPNFKIKADFTELAEGRVFPYHYDRRVKQELADSLVEVCRSAGVSLP